MSAASASGAAVAPGWQPASPGSPRSMIRAYFGEQPWGPLHARPTYYVIVLCAIFSSVCTYVLDQHVLSTKDHVGVFLMGSYVVFSSYFMINYFLEKHSTSFRKISREKKFYTISNLLKAGILSSITPFAMWQLYLIVVWDTWDSNTLKNLGCIYSIPDFVSMLVVHRMAWTTRAHHICVVIFNYFSIQNDYSQVNVCRLIVVYAAFSTLAYCVNMLLASRFLGVSSAVSRYLSMASLGVYVTCCAVNWTWQVYYLRRLVSDFDHWTIYLYMLLIAFVMFDDVVLVKWLLLNVKNTGGFGGTRLIPLSQRAAGERDVADTTTQGASHFATATWTASDGVSTIFGRIGALLAQRDAR